MKNKNMSQLKMLFKLFQSSKIVCILFFISSHHLFSQTVLLNVERSNDTLVQRQGPNQKAFTHFIFRIGEVISKDNAGAKIIYGTSIDLGFGFRTKYKFSALYSMGWEFGYNFTDYKLK